MKGNMVFVVLVLAIITGASAGYLWKQYRLKQLPQVSAGYKRYIESCLKAGEVEFTCRCQAGLLAKRLPDRDLILLTQAGEAVEAGDMATVNALQTSNPHIFTAMDELADEAAKCVLE